MSKLSLLTLALCLLVAVFVSATSQEEMKEYLRNYQEIANIQQGYRVFRNNAGHPELTSYSLTDERGLHWFANQELHKIYIFTGAGFIDVNSTNRIASTDTLESVFQTDNKTPFFTGSKHLYKWNGTRLIAYRFPDKDKLEQAYGSLDNSVICFGQKGYAELIGHKWTYKPYKGFSIASDRKNELLIDSFYHKHDKALIRLSHIAGKPDSAKVEVIRSGHKYESSVPYFGQQIFAGLDLTFQENNQGTLFFTIKKTRYIYYLTTGATKANTITLYRGHSPIDLFKDVQGNVFLLGCSKDGESFSLEISEFYLDNRSISRVSSISLIKKPEHEIYGSYCYFWQGKMYSLDNKYYELSSGKNKFFEYYDFDKRKIVSLALAGVLVKHSSNDETNEVTLYVKHPDYHNVTNLEIYSFKTDQEPTKICSLPMKTDDITQFKPIYDKNALYFVIDQELRIAQFEQNLKKIIRFQREQESLYRYSGQQVAKLIEIDGKNYVFAQFIKDASCISQMYRLDEDVPLLVTEVIEPFKNYQFSMLSNATFTDYSLGRIYFRTINDWRFYDTKTGHASISNLNPSKPSFLSNSIIKVFITPATGELLLANELDQNFRATLKIENLFNQHGINSSIDDTAFLTYAIPFTNSAPIYDSESNCLFVEGHSISNFTDRGYSYNDVGKDIISGVKVEKVSQMERKTTYPTHCVNLASGKIDLFPNWLSVFQNKDGKIYVLYKEIPGDFGYLYLREVVNGVAISKPSDPKIPWSQYKDAYIVPKTLDGELMLPIGDSVYYLQTGVWNKLKLDRIRYTGDFANGISTNDGIFIGYYSCVVKYLPDGSSFVYAQNEGIPKGRIYLHKIQDKILINCGDTIYEFIEPKLNIKLINAWYYAGDRITNSKTIQKFPHSIGSIRFPIIAPNVLYPEKCFLEYHLTGFNDKPVRIPFTKEIRFDKLKPGKYSFSYQLIHSTGEKAKSTPILFSITPPIYFTWWAWLIYAFAALAIIRSIFVLRTRQLRLRNLVLEDTISLRTQELREKQKRIQESIEYAYLIQKSILPQKQQLIDAFKQHFIIWQPRDIVGGDFYWLHTSDKGETFFAVIDCTGHGVPGALLSMTVNALLDKLVHDIGMREPGIILTTMHQEIGTALHQDMEHTQQDGIEIALIRIDKAARELCFSGAGLHLLHRTAEGLQHIRGGKHGLGGLRWHSQLSFTEQTIPYSEASRIYLYTDGIIDQPILHNTKTQRLGHPKWLEFISEISDKPFAEQQECCRQLIADMLQVHEQRDDITIIGFAL